MALIYVFYTRSSAQPGMAARFAIIFLGVNIEEFRDYCLLKAGVTEELPFGPETLVFKVGGKVFALTPIETFASINLKCDPARALELREQHDYVLPGYHMNKKHWNTILVGSGATAAHLHQWIDHSYNLVLASLPKAQRAAILADSTEK